MITLTPHPLRLFAEILCKIAYDQDPPSGYFEESLEDALSAHGLTKDQLDALAKELGFDWRCQDEPDDPSTLCPACGGGFAGSRKRSLCCCAEGAKVDRGAELRHKSSSGQCYRTGCDQRADVDGWCDEHSWQFQNFGTHHPQGAQGAQGPQEAP